MAESKTEIVMAWPPTHTHWHRGKACVYYMSLCIIKKYTHPHIHTDILRYRNTFIHICILRVRVSKWVPAYMRTSVCVFNRR